MCYYYNALTCLVISGADNTAALAAATRRAAQTVSLYMIESVCRQSV